MSVILILLILYLHKENHMYDRNFIMVFFSPITKTDISTSKYSSAYLYINFKRFILT